MLGILSGFLLANSLPTYGGVGINLLWIAVDQQVVEPGAFMYTVFGIFALIMTILLGCLAFLLLAEFLKKKFHFTPVMRIVIVPSVLTLSMLHILVSLGLVAVPDIQLREVLIDSSLLYSVLVISSVVLFMFVHWIDPRGNKRDVSQ